MAERNLNLKLTPAEEALAKYLSALNGKLVPKFEVISVEESLGRITSAPVCAKLNSPHYNAAAMDGIAVKSADFNNKNLTTEYCCPTNSLEFHGERKSPGTNDSGQLQLPILRDLCGLNSSRSHFDFINVNTGDIVQEPYDAVIMAEDLPYTGEKNVLPGQHVRHIGESIKIGEEILSAKHKIRPVDIGMLLTAGITTVEVYTTPKVAIFPTGSEIINICSSNFQDGEVPEAGKIIESNSRMYEAQIKQAGGEGVRFEPLLDNFALLKNAITKAVHEFDMVLINAGSSAGTEDFTVQVLREIGEVIVHGVAMKPGKPVILAIVNGKPVIGTPGYPVSAFLSFETFALPILSVLTGSAIKPKQKIEAVLAERITSTPKQREYVRIKLEQINGKLTAVPLTRHSGVAMSLVKADGFCIVDIGCECIEAGETVIIEMIEQ